MYILRKNGLLKDQISRKLSPEIPRDPVGLVTPSSLPIWLMKLNQVNIAINVVGVSSLEKATCRFFGW